MATETHMLTEVDVGIQCFATSSAGFSAILKHRYADFQVYEVSLEGEVAHLPKAKGEQAPQSHVDKRPFEEKATRTERSLKPYEACAADFAAIAGQAHADKLKAFLRDVLQAKDEQAPPSHVDIGPFEEKATRTAVHAFLAAERSGVPRLHTVKLRTTEPGPERTTEPGPEPRAEPGPEPEPVRLLIRVSVAKPRAAVASEQSAVPHDAPVNGGGTTRGKRPREENGDSRVPADSWPGGPARRFLRFCLRKENADTPAAVDSLARALHVQASRFAYCGTKDKRAVTYQWVTAFMVTPDSLEKLNGQVPRMRVGTYSFVRNALGLGELQGNDFRVVLRDLRGTSTPQVLQACDQVRELGFINYYGLQRFGSGNIRTHQIGALLLRGEWWGAVDAIVGGGHDEREEFRMARHMYLEHCNAEVAFENLPRWMVAERAVLSSLAFDDRCDAAGALLRVPRSLRSLYLHAFQAALWNSAASERVRRYGTKHVVEGDLVISQAATGSKAGSKVGPESAKGSSQQLAADAGGEGSGAGPAAPTDWGVDDLYNDVEEYSEADHRPEMAGPARADPAKAGEAAEAEADAQGDGWERAYGPGGEPRSAAARCAHVHVVTSAEAEGRVYSVFDVVLPLPGRDVIYPRHSVADVYQQRAADLGVDLHSRPHNVKEFSLTSLSGDYRHVLHRPANLRAEVVTYDHPDHDLLHDDGGGAKSPGDPLCNYASNVRPVRPSGPAAGGGTSAAQPLADLVVPVQAPEAAAAGPAGGVLAGAGSVAMDVDGGVGAQARSPMTVSSSEGPAPPQHTAGGGQDTDMSPVANSAEQQGGALRALVLSFRLPPSTYATMLVRELLRSSTAKDVHKQLSLPTVPQHNS